MRGKEQQSNEIEYEVTDLAEDGYSAHALCHGIVVEGKAWQDLKTMVREAVHCHFERADFPSSARLKHEREETITI